MIARQTVNDYLEAEPFRPFVVHLVSGRTFEIRYPELIKLLQSTMIIFKYSDDGESLSDQWHTVSLMLVESISHLGASIH